jgi:hypothetical protein
MNLRFGIFGLGLFLGCVLGCGGGTSSQPDPNYDLVNFCTDANLDLLIDDTTVYTNIGFDDPTTPFKTTKSKLQDFSIEQTGSTVIIDSQTQAMSSNTDNLIIAVGLNNFGTEN